VPKLRTDALIFAIMLLLSSSSYASVIGSAGATYPIIEKDALNEIEENVDKIDWKRHMNRMKDSLVSYRPANLHPLSRAKEDRTFAVDLTYTLEFDIPDGNGGILYPKGYTFNPLDYASLPNILVFINGDDKKQIEWFRNSVYSGDHRVMLLLTDGSYVSLSERLQRPVFYASRQIAERFRLQAVPSVVYQQGKTVEVKEFGIKDVE
jgi:conjugal transfer pilus assembly protein TraW